jgi:MoaA/NifB/PqqE/SkfB family radical SAM enzyme
MESVYWVLSWACHRKCVHCYDDRFRPYVRGQLEEVVAEGELAFARIVRHLPDDFSYAHPHADGRTERRTGRIILAGGEVLVDPVRERVLYPTLDAIQSKYRGGVRVSVQTTGDLVTPEILRDLKSRGVWMVAISGMDDFHVGMEGEKRLPLQRELDAMFADTGFSQVSLSTRRRDYTTESGPFYLYFGADPNSWIGELWPRGRAWTNGLSDATLETNFCARQSGAKNFLNMGQLGSEVSIEPNGDVYPCCLKTREPLGNLTEERLEDILASLRGHPAFEALNRGDPERMGETLGWDAERMRSAAKTTTPKGEPYANLCIACDRFHDAVLRPIIRDIRQRRLQQMPRRVADVAAGG